MAVVCDKGVFPNLGSVIRRGGEAEAGDMAETMAKTVGKFTDPRGKFIDNFRERNH